MVQNLVFGVNLLISDFLAESLKAIKKLAKKITHFTILQYSFAQKTSLILRTLTMKL